MELFKAGSERVSFGSYSAFKGTMDKNVRDGVESFVRIGYLLKVARDTGVLGESEYSSMAEFALKEYGMDASQTSRFMAINDKYSRDGYSMELKEEYQRFGVAKLGEMLTLPEVISEAISPEYTKEEIREIKQEIKEEQGITDIEVMLEPKPEGEMNIWQRTLKESFRGMPEEYINLYDRLKVVNSRDAEKEAIMDILAPAGITTIMARVEGTGRMMISIRGENQEIGLINIRSEEKESESWENFIADMLAVIDTDTSVDAKDKWQQIYGMDFPAIEKEEEEKEERKPEKKPEHIKIAKKIAPVQPKKEEKKKEVAPEPKQSETNDGISKNTVRIIPPEDDEPTVDEDDSEKQHPAAGNETNENLNKLYSIYRSIHPVLNRIKTETGMDQEALNDLCSKADILKSAAESMMSRQQDDNLPGQMNISDYKE